jgi:hypothetical protein
VLDLQVYLAGWRSKYHEEQQCLRCAVELRLSTFTKQPCCLLLLVVVVVVLLLLLLFLCSFEPHQAALRAFRSPAAAPAAAAAEAAAPHAEPPQCCHE